MRESRGVTVCGVAVYRRVWVLLFKLQPSSDRIEGLRALLHWKLATYLAYTMMYPALSFIEITVTLS